eukprot:sb/3476037/
MIIQRPIPNKKPSNQPTDTSKQPIRTRYLGHVTGYQGPGTRNIWTIIPFTVILQTENANEEIEKKLVDEQSPSLYLNFTNEARKVVSGHGDHSPCSTLLIAYFNSRNRPTQVNNQSELVI